MDNLSPHNGHHCHTLQMSAWLFMNEHDKLRMQRYRKGDTNDIIYAQSNDPIILYEVGLCEGLPNLQIYSWIERIQSC